MKYKEKKILFVHDFPFYLDENSYIYTAVGLPEIYFDRYFNAGFNEVNIFSRISKGESREIKKLGYSCIGSKNINLAIGVSKKYLSIFNPFLLFRVLHIIKLHDLIVVNTPSIIGAYISLLSIITKKPYAVEVASDTDMFLSKKFGYIPTKFFNFFMPIFIKNAIGATYVTIDLFKRFPNNNGIIASNVNIKEIGYGKTLQKNLKEKEIIKIGFIGGLTKRKGIDALIKSIDLIVKEGYQNIRVYLVGGHEDENWKKIIKDLKLEKYFNFLGILPPNDVSKALDTFDLYIQPSLSEGLPRATLEAMAKGLPVIATRLPGFKEILNGDFLVPVSSHKALFEKIILLLNNKDIYNELSIQNQNRAKEFLYSTLNKKRVDYYNKLLRELA